MHGHSRKQNVFMYGCNKFEDPQWTRVFPFMLSKLNPHFSFENSRFGIQKDKEATARITLFKELRDMPCVYTMESTFAGLDYGKEKGTHMSVHMLEQMGRDLCRTILIYKGIFVPDELKKIFKVRKQSSSALDKDK